MDDLKTKKASQAKSLLKNAKKRPDPIYDAAVKGEPIQDGETNTPPHYDTRNRGGNGVIASLPSVMSVSDHEEAMLLLQTEFTNLKKSSDKKIKELSSTKKKLEDDNAELLRSV